MPGRIKMIEATAAFLIKSTLILVLASAYCRWESRSSAERHAVAFIALLALPVTAVGGRLVPWSMTLPEPLPEVLGRASAATPPTATASPLTWLVIGYVCVLAVLMTATVAEFWQSSRYTRRLPDYPGGRLENTGCGIRMRSLTGCMAFDTRSSSPRASPPGLRIAVAALLHNSLTSAGSTGTNARPVHLQRVLVPAAGLGESIFSYSPNRRATHCSVEYARHSW